jgi:hypothetical protein
MGTGYERVYERAYERVYERVFTGISDWLAEEKLAHSEEEASLTEGSG